MADRIYDPKDILVIWGGRPLAGFAPDSKIKISTDEDKLSLEVGIDGDEAVFTVNNSQQGKTEINLFTSCETDKVLDGIMTLGEIDSSLLIAPMTVTDIRSGATWFTASAGISKRPDTDYSKGKSPTATYVFIYPRMRQTKGTPIPTI